MVGPMTLRAAIPTALAACLLAGTAHGDNLARRLAAAAPGLAPQVLERALDAVECAQARGEAPRAERLAVIDYSLPSTEPRLWVFDLGAQRLMYAEHVAHGRNSGANHATDFSNEEGSHRSSIGLFRTADTYIGGNGYSLRLDGLDPGFNDRARERYIVMHGAPYVDPVAALGQGRLGRSQGCPAVRPQVARELIDSLRDGQLLFAWYPDPRWLEASPNLNCGNRLARNRAMPPNGAAGRHGVLAAP
jgi:hypothetical protein